MQKYLREDNEDGNPYLFAEALRVVAQLPPQRKEGENIDSPDHPVRKSIVSMLSDPEVSYKQNARIHNTSDSSVLFVADFGV